MSLNNTVKKVFIRIVIINGFKVKKYETKKINYPSFHDQPHCLMKIF